MSDEWSECSADCDDMKVAREKSAETSTHGLLHLEGESDFVPSTVVKLS